MPGQISFQEYAGLWQKVGGQGEWFRISEGCILWPNGGRDKMDAAGDGAFCIRRADQVHHFRFTDVAGRPHWLTWNDGTGGTYVRDEPALAPLFGEFLGTFVLVLAVSCCNINGVGADWRPESVACALVALIYALGAVSRGHLNPAVSIAVGLARKMPWLRVLSYIAAQFLGSVAACASNMFFFSPRITKVEPGIGFHWWQALVVEAVFTSVLAFVVLNVAYSAVNNPSGNPNGFYALAIGFAAIAGGHAAGPISGGVLNPAVSLAHDLSNYREGMGGFLLFSFAQIVGAAAGACLFRLVRPEDYQSTRSERREAGPSLATRLACEFIGTFNVAAVSSMCILADSPMGPWAVAAALSCMVYALGDASGGHFNPAVTFAFLCIGRRDCLPSVGLKYIVIQVAGASLAGTLACGLHTGATVPVEVKTPVGAALAGSANWIGCKLEAVFTFALVLAVLAVSCARTNFYGLAIGLCVAAGGLASQAVTGGALNPALIFGAAANDSFLNDGPLDAAWRLCVAEFVGGCMAALIFSVTHTHELEK